METATFIAKKKKAGVELEGGDLGIIGGRLPTEPKREVVSPTPSTTFALSSG